MIYLEQFYFIFIDKFVLKEVEVLIQDSIQNALFNQDFIKAS